ncbi:MAG: hypothetical protein PHC48_07375 [Prevotella sp.]|nr:hypothetical protein [Prevotella sp.]
MKRLLSIMAVVMVTFTLHAQLPAFPGAEGFGALATGGRESRTVVHVTNLNAEGPGSLAEALKGSNRIVVFDVGGIINLSPSQMIAIDQHDNITVLGQTAPGDGITIYGNRVLIRNCKNIIFRYIRMRGSINMASDAETLTMDYAENVVLDHCSISWGRWDDVHIKEANDITWQYCIISEGIDPQRFGAITDGTRNWTISHCLWIDNNSRNPKMKCYAQMINSVVYNGGNGVVGGHSSADNYQDLINNYYISGPQGESDYSQWTSTDHLYQKGNLWDNNKDGVLNGTEYINTSCTNMDYPHFAPTAPVTIESPEEAYASVVAQAGCSRVRDIHDLRLINQLKSLGTDGKILTSEGDVGGIGTLNGGTPIIDSDHDGIADDWETANGLNPNNASDAVETAPDGYLWIEKYANSLASETSFLTYPTGLKINYIGSDKTTAGISWVNADNRATAILLEMSNDGDNFIQVDSFSAKSTFRSFTNMNPEKVYYFRLRSTDGKRYSSYSSIVSINEPPGIQPGGGTSANVKAFMPKAGKLYRIICYASQYYNSGTTMGGAPQYLTTGTLGTNTTLVSTTVFDAQNPAILWTIQQDSIDSTQYKIHSYSRDISLSPTMVNDYIVLDQSANKFNITFVGNFLPKQSGMSDSLSFYRINSPDNNNYQIRAKSATQWLWGGGTITRADMIFTFQEIDASLIGIYIKNLKAKVDEAEVLLSSATTGTGTLQYPDGARDALVGSIEDAYGYLSNYKTLHSTQAEIDSIQQVVTNQISAFTKLRNVNWGECDTTKYFAIYSYGTASNSGTTTASASTARRYLADYGVGLVFRVGLTDAETAQDTLLVSKNAQWFCTPDTLHKGSFWVKNVATGRYLNVANIGLTTSPTTTYPVYNNTDNGKYAFSVYASLTNTTSLSIGTIDADGLGGSLQNFPGTANRTRLRWIFDATGDVSTTGIKSPITTRDNGKNDAWYNLVGIKVSKPSKGIYIHKGKAVLVP